MTKKDNFNEWKDLFGGTDWDFDDDVDFEDTEPEDELSGIDDEEFDRDYIAPGDETSEDDSTPRDPFLDWLYDIPGMSFGKNSKQAENQNKHDSSTSNNQSSDKSSSQSHSQTQKETFTPEPPTLKHEKARKPKPINIDTFFSSLLFLVTGIALSILSVLFSIFSDEGITGSVLIATWVGVICYSIGIILVLAGHDEIKTAANGISTVVRHKKAPPSKGAKQKEIRKVSNIYYIIPFATCALVLCTAFIPGVQYGCWFGASNADDIYYFDSATAIKSILRQDTIYSKMYALAYGSIFIMMLFSFIFMLLKKNIPLAFSNFIFIILGLIAIISFAVILGHFSFQGYKGRLYSNEYWHYLDWRLLDLEKLRPTDAYSYYVSNAPMKLALPFFITGLLSHLIILNTFGKNKNTTPDPSSSLVTYQSKP